MRFVFASYVHVDQFHDPTDWLNRIAAFTGILAALAEKNEVHSLQQINFKGNITKDQVHYHFKKYTRNELRFFPLRLNLYLKKLMPDVIIIQGLHCPFQVLQLRFTVGPKVKIIVQHRAEKPFNGIKKFLQQLADKYIAAYLFGAKLLAQEWLQRGNLNDKNKIYEVAGLSSIFLKTTKASALQQTKATGSPIFLWVGRLNVNKDPLTVLHAFLNAANHLSQSKLYMIYQTEELLPEIKAVLAKDTNREKVELLGHLPHTALAAWFNAADFLISGSYYEGGGTVLCEALSVGCIPIVTAIPSFQMITNNGKCGFLYEPGNVVELTTILKNTETLTIAEKRKECLDFFRSHLSFEAIADKIQAIGSI